MASEGLLSPVGSPGGLLGLDDPEGQQAAIQSALATLVHGAGIVHQMVPPMGPSGAAPPPVFPRLSHDPFSQPARNDNPYWHPISPVKLSKPISEMQHTTEPGPAMVPRQPLSLEDMVGSYLLPLVGDRSRVGQITSIGGNPVDVQSYGGMDFMRTHAPENTAWASGKGIVTGLQNATNQLGDEAPVLGVYGAMGSPSVDFSTMMSKAIMDQMPYAPITNAAKKGFDAFMRQPVKESGGEINLSDWPGLDSPNAMSVLNERGPMRKYLAKKMELAQFSKQGFPDIPQTRVALTDPSLLDYNRGVSGFNVAKLVPGAAPITPLTTPHPTYPVGLAGQYAGSLDVPLPRDIMFSTGYAKRRAAGADPFRDAKSFESSPLGWATFADQQWLDNASKWLEAYKAGLVPAPK